MPDQNQDEEESKAFQFRCPLPIYEILQERIKKSRRSLNAEIIVCLEEYFKINPDDIRKQIELLETTLKAVENAKARLDVRIEEAVKVSATLDAKKH